MSYISIKPGIPLQPYIDAYWHVQTGRSVEAAKQRILPDGCVDLICCLGNEVFTSSGNTTLQTDKVYLVGTMTTFAESSKEPHANLIGIRFKPGGFSFFYQQLIFEVTDNCIEFERDLMDAAFTNGDDIFTRLDQYFLNKLKVNPAHNLLPVITGIIESKNVQRIETLAKKHYTTIKQLERSFKQHIGISPKEFVNIIRFQSAMEKIKQNEPRKSLLDIAFETGYYDHAHLSNAIKRYTGLTPSQL